MMSFARHTAPKRLSYEFVRLSPIAKITIVGNFVRIIDVG